MSRSGLIRILHVGCGGMSQAWLSSVAELEGVELCGLVDLNLDQAHSRAGEFGLSEAACYTDLGAALAAHSPDVVFDCTIPAAHHGVTLTALAAGCHVLGEKPMAETMKQAHEMVRAAQDAGKLYAVIQNRRYQAAIRRVQHALNAGAIGRVHTINADFYLGAHFGGFRDEMDHVLLLDMAIHSFDQARFLGSVDPVTVYCKEYNPTGSWYRHGASAMAIFEMTDEVVFNYRGSWCAEGHATTWECDWRIIGERGTLRWDGGEKISIEAPKVGASGFILPLESIEVPNVDWDERDNGHGGLIREFIECVSRGGRPLTHAEDNIRSLAMVHGAIESARCGHVVAVS